jgi:hypothetical protein
MPLQLQLAQSKVKPSLLQSAITIIGFIFFELGDASIFVHRVTKTCLSRLHFIDYSSVPYQVFALVYIGTISRHSLGIFKINLYISRNGSQSSQMHGLQ